MVSIHHKIEITDLINIHRRQDFIAQICPVNFFPTGTGVFLPGQKSIIKIGITINAADNMINFNFLDSCIVLPFDRNVA
jgi:hypothetical protein